MLKQIQKSRKKNRSFERKKKHYQKHAINHAKSITIGNILEENSEQESYVSFDVNGEPVWFSSTDIELSYQKEIPYTLFLTMAAICDVPLITPHPIDKHWLKKISPNIKKYTSWLGVKSTMAKIEQGHDHIKSQKPSQKKAACFSLGVDSFYTLEKNKTDIDYLVLVHGFDVPLNNDKWFSELHKKAKKIAEQYNKKLIIIKTNLREHNVYQHMPWNYVGYGPALVATGFVMAKNIGQFFISASIVDGEDFRGSGRIDITPLWGNKKLAIEQKGGELSRAEKLGYLLANEVALDNLSVCWSHPDNYGNCGVCEKCIRTQIVLVLYNTYEGNKIFPYNDINGLIDAINNMPASALDEVLTAAYRRSFLDQGLPSNLELAVTNLVSRSEGNHD